MAAGQTRLAPGRQEQRPNTRLPGVVSQVSAVCLSFGAHRAAPKDRQMDKRSSPFRECDPFRVTGSVPLRGDVTPLEQGCGRANPFWRSSVIVGNGPLR